MNENSIYFVCFLLQKTRSKFSILLTLLFVTKNAGFDSTIINLKRIIQMIKLSRLSLCISTVLLTAQSYNAMAAEDEIERIEVTGHILNALIWKVHLLLQACQPKI